MRVDAPRIRRARPEDAPVIAAAERAIATVPGRLASSPDEIDDDAVRRMIVELEERGRGAYLVAEHAGTIVAHAFLEPLPVAATSHVVRLTIAVHEGHQRRGIGRTLMNDLLRWAQSTPRVEKVELQVRSSNEPAIALYRSLGFVEEGRKTRRLKIAPNEWHRTSVGPPSTVDQTPVGSRQSRWRLKSPLPRRPVGDIGQLATRHSGRL